MFELKYFIEVSKTKNIFKASKILGISPSAISKAITRLENELEVKLFEKIGRNIEITENGKSLQKDALEILTIEKRAKENLSFKTKNVELKIVGPELLLAHWGSQVIGKVKKKYKGLSFSLEVCSNEEALEKLESFEADIAIISGLKKADGKMDKEIDVINFHLFASKKHPFTKNASIPIDEIISGAFIVNDSTFTGLKTTQGNNDGWRDDKFERKNLIKTKSLKCLESLLINGHGVSYLPDFYGKSLGLHILNVDGCPYQCRQKVYIKRNKYTLEEVWSLI